MKKYLEIWRLGKSFDTPKGPAEIVRDFAAKNPKQGFTIFDLGSGDGSFTRRISAQVPSARIIGLEISHSPAAGRTS